MARLAATILKILNAVGLPDPNTLSNPETRGFWGSDLNAVIAAMDGEIALTYAGNPNGVLASPYVSRFCWDSVNNKHWVCTKAGASAAETIWDDVALLASARADITNVVVPTPSVLFEAVPEEPLPTDLTFVRASTAMRMNQLGFLQSVAVNEIRHQYDPETGEYLGWLLEKASTNYLTYSQELDNGAYSKFGHTVTANADVAPDGTTTADRLVESSATTSRNSRRLSNTLPSAQAATFSVFVKPDATRKGVTLFMYGGTGSVDGIAVDFNLDALTDSVQAVGGATDVFSWLEPYPDGWFRLAVSLKTPSAVTNWDAYLYFSPDPTNGNATYAGDGTSGILAWGMQLEPGNVPTSYIPTVASTVTRSGDLLELYTSQYPWYTPARGTFLVEDRLYKEIGVSKFNSTIFASSSNYLGFQDSGGGTVSARIVQGGSFVSTLSLAFAATPKDTRRMAMSWSPNFQAAAINGRSMGSGTVALSALSATKMQGNQAGSNESVVRTLRRIGYWSRTLTLAELQKLTGV